MSARNQLELITYRKEGAHVSQDTVQEFENAIASGNVKRKELDPFSAFLGSLFHKLVIRRKLPLFPALAPKKDKDRLCILMGLEFHKPFVPFLFNKSNHVYFFDAWPGNHGEMEQFIRILNVRNVFFSSGQVTEIFKKKNLPCRFHWLSEGISLTDYSSKPYPDKDIEVLSFGRKYDWLHEKIQEGLHRSKINYLYEKRRGEIIFKDRAGFIDGLARTKISICVPSNITHPERAGEISTMTVRYLQSMAAKALIVGIMPKDMKELFDYDPMITLDMTDPLAQIKHILENYSSYIPLIERNYNYISQHHTWANRWSDLQRILQEDRA